MSLTTLSAGAATGDASGASRVVAASTFSTYTRIYGQTADATASAELAHQFTSAAGHCPGTTSTRSVILATDADYPDALASSYLARSLGTGTLLTPGTSLSAATRTALRDEGITHVYVVGGPLAISTSVLAEIRALPVYACGGSSEVSGATLEVTRISGQTEYTTAAAIAETPSSSTVGSVNLSGAYAGVNASGGDGAYNDTAGNASGSPEASGALRTAIVATGDGFQDAEAASTLAYAESLPILLTTPASLSAQVSAAITKLQIEQVIVMGGQVAIADSVVSGLESLGVSVLRVAGENYGNTATELAGMETASTPAGLGWSGNGSVTVARGDFFTDGLAGAVVAADGPTAASPEPLLLTTNPTTVGTTLATFLYAAGTKGIGGTKVTHFVILGGPVAITQTTINSMGEDLSVAPAPAPPTPAPSTTPYATTFPLKSPNPATHAYVPPANPPSNTAPDPTFAEVCGTTFSQAKCIAAEISAIDNARATEDLGPMVLPTNFSSLTTIEQVFVITDIERTSRGEAPVEGLSTLLNATAQVGANDTTDPNFAIAQATLHTFVSGGSNWSGASSMLYSHYLWMYLDGYGGDNLDCQSPTTAGCWGHRDDVLLQGTYIVMGAAKKASGDSYTEIFVSLSSAKAAPALYYTWTDALAAGAKA